MDQHPIPIRTWVKSIPSRSHPDRNEDAYWSARNGMAHAIIDGMGGSRRVVNGKEIGGEHAAAGLCAALDERLQDLPNNVSVSAAREILSAVIAEGNERVYKHVNAEGNIPPEQIPEGKTANEVMAAACLTALAAGQQPARGDHRGLQRRRAPRRGHGRPECLRAGRHDRARRR